MLEIVLYIMKIMVIKKNISVALGVCLLQDSGHFEDDARI